MEPSKQLNQMIFVAGGGKEQMVLNEFVEELDVAIKQDGHDIYCNAETAKMLKSLINEHQIHTIYATPPNDSKEKTTTKDIANIKFKVPENCGSCLSMEQFGNKYIRTVSGIL